MTQIQRKFELSWSVDINANNKEQAINRLISILNSMMKEDPDIWIRESWNIEEVTEEFDGTA